MKRRRGTRGLSQLELMISLAMMGLMATVLANVLNFNRLSIERSQRVAVNTEFELSRLNLRTWIESLSLTQVRLDEFVALSGDEQHFRLSSRTPNGAFSDQSPVVISLETIAQASRTDLLAIGSGMHSTESEALEIRQVLGKDISRLVVHYYGRISSESQNRWHTRWSDDTFLPLLIKIEWDNADGRPAPPLTLEPAKTERQLSLIHI